MIVYTSRTGNVRYIVGELKLPSVEITQGLVVNEPYFLFTYTDGLGSTPEIIKTFLHNVDNQKYLKGVIASGNSNFGQYYCKSAEKISEVYNVPIIRKIDLRGTQEDLNSIINQYNKYIGVNSE